MGIVTKWFVCLLAEVLPVETVLRIWDCLFNEGSKILFRVAITLVKLNEEELLKCSEFGEMAETFTKSLGAHPRWTVTFLWRRYSSYPVRYLRPRFNVCVFFTNKLNRALTSKRHQNAPECTRIIGVYDRKVV